jgi:hypothetical protein
MGIWPFNDGVLTAMAARQSAVVKVRRWMRVMCMGMALFGTGRLGRPVKYFPPQRRTQLAGTPVGLGTGGRQ